MEKSNHFYKAVHQFFSFFQSSKKVILVILPVISNFSSILGPPRGTKIDEIEKKRVQKFMRFLTCKKKAKIDEKN